MGLLVPVVRDTSEEGVKQVFQARQVVGGEQLVQPVQVGAGAAVVGTQGEQQLLDQSHTHFVIGVAQVKEVFVAGPLRVIDGEIAGLEQQRLDRHVVDIEARQQ